MLDSGLPTMFSYATRGQSVAHVYLSTKKKSADDDDK